ncbi:TRAP transporter small permease subunit [Pseudohalocynthiibacter aestuariivivens]|jgi:TRAP-type C4-dicarboxylate transport system permease small subunit|uniref:TRAP transporter small permease protein n=1 Tax=Pseudohalocynthiibacter aestuariivivens TaxID=1591409 RepID=A0ABV5JD98_9RHOB|nr:MULTISPECIES: TRAP transporter small permease subunit [Pseudohalocynthiibacter]MBS9717069.1 TRAP transporter small permease subunit [Pseudohalocynthiibacter aestuariivivens]MCK0104007.1 TRAP transporter small permease [Pseudohalocynthiibacter sp. F2068]
MKLLETLRTVNRGVALLVGVMLLACAAFVLLDIVLRQLGSSFGGTDEISGYVMAIATSWGMAYTMLELGHVRIDLLRSRRQALGRSLFDLLSMLVLSGTIVLIAIRCWPVLERSLKNSSTANTPLETPLALVQGPWFAGWLWFAIMACLTTLAALRLILKGQFAQSEAAIGAFAEQDTVQ